MSTILFFVTLAMVFGMGWLFAFMQFSNKINRPWLDWKRIQLERVKIDDPDFVAKMKHWEIDQDAYDAMVTVVYSMTFPWSKTKRYTRKDL